MYNRDQYEKWKVAVYWFSVIFLLTGGSLIAFSTWAFLVNPLNALASILPVSFIVTGTFIFVVSFMGWYSSTRESPLLLGVYVFLIVCSICVVFGLTIFTFYTDPKDINDSLYSSWQQEFAINNNTDGKLYNIEIDYSCCGFWDRYNYSVPIDCAQKFPTFSDGCQQDLTEVNLDALNNVRITGLAATFVQLVGLFFACLALRFAPTQRDREALLNEEAERLNEAWTKNKL